MWDKCNCGVIWTFFGIAFLWVWNENWPFPVLWPQLSFPNLLAYWVQHFVDHDKLWKILKEMGIPDHLTCLLRNLFAGQESTVRTRHGTTDWFQRGRGVCQGCTLSPCLFNLYAENIMRSAELDEAQAGIKIAGRTINNLYMQMTPHLWQKAKKKKRDSWSKWRREWESCLKTQHSEN